MRLCDFEVGPTLPFFLIAGPCVVESEQLAMDTAGQLKELTTELQIPFIYKLVKIGVFSSKRVDELKVIYSLNSEEMEFFKKALEISKEFRFFYKWEALIPLFQKNEEYINVILILAEGYTHERCYSLSILYNRKTKELIRKNERFEKIKKWSDELNVIV